MLFEADKPKPGTGGRPLDIHPLIVLVVTALGGVIGGIVGLILAVPFFAIARTLSPTFDPETSPSWSPTAPNRPCDAYSDDVGCSGHACHNPQVDIAATAQTCGLNSAGTGFTTWT
jgi:hypothetical protein